MQNYYTIYLFKKNNLKLTRFISLALLNGGLISLDCLCFFSVEYYFIIFMIQCCNNFSDISHSLGSLQNPLYRENINPTLNHLVSITLAAKSPRPISLNALSCLSVTICWLRGQRNNLVWRWTADNILTFGRILDIIKQSFVCTVNHQYSGDVFHVPLCFSFSHFSCKGSSYF